MSRMYIACCCDEYAGDALVCAQKIASGTTTPCECACHQLIEESQYTCYESSRGIRSCIYQDGEPLTYGQIVDLLNERVQ